MSIGLAHSNGVKTYLTATTVGAGRNRFYVYLLVDPRTGLPFYVGKGRNDRCHQHLRFAKQGYPGKRHEVIREILASGLELEVRRVKWFDSECEALNYERELIATIGLENLCNGNRGQSVSTDEPLYEVSHPDIWFRAGFVHHKQYCFSSPERFKVFLDQWLIQKAIAKPPAQIFFQNCRIFPADGPPIEFRQLQTDRGVCDQVCAVLVGKHRTFAGFTNRPVFEVGSMIQIAEAS